jgi:hypothetical protein
MRSITVFFLLFGLIATPCVYAAAPAKGCLTSFKHYSKYHQLTAKTHPRYLAKVEKAKAQLKQQIPYYLHGSFYGACAADTLWAQTMIENPEIMAAIYAENSLPQSPSPALAELTHFAEQGGFPSRAHFLTSYKADPAQPSIIRLTATVSGPRIAATTQLTAEGLSVQAAKGCVGCHQRG